MSFHPGPYESARPPRHIPLRSPRRCLVLNVAVAQERVQYLRCDFLLAGISTFLPQLRQSKGTERISQRDRLLQRLLHHRLRERVSGFKQSSHHIGQLYRLSTT